MKIRWEGGQIKIDVSENFGVMHITSSTVFALVGLSICSI